MFASRNHDENAIYGQQTAAAAKPLNQGIKGLAPKTPSAKTPFRSKSNDENAAFAIGKAAGKVQGGKIQQSALVTPAGPQTRAPLGNKTTNAKAGAFKTPGLNTLDKQPKQSSPRQRRAKVKIHQPTPLAENSDDEYPEIEYMPPREIPLPDYPEEWPADRTYPQFKGENMVRGWMAEEAPEPLTAEEDAKRWKERMRKALENEERERVKALNAKAPTLSARDAASALSTKSRRAVAPAKVPTTTRQPSSSSSYKKPSATGVKGPSHTAARVASNTTLGYSKGRAVSASSRPPISQIHRPETVEKQSVPGIPGTNFDELLRLSFVKLDDSDDGRSQDGDAGGVLLDMNLEDDNLLGPDFKLGPVDE